MKNKSKRYFLACITPVLFLALMLTFQGCGSDDVSSSGSDRVIETRKGKVQVSGTTVKFPDNSTVSLNYSSGEEKETFAGILTLKELEAIKDWLKPLEDNETIKFGGKSYNINKVDVSKDSQDEVKDAATTAVKDTISDNVQQDVKNSVKDQISEDLGGMDSGGMGPGGMDPGGMGPGGMDPYMPPPY